MRKILARRIAPIDKEARPIEQLNVIAKVSFGGQLFLRGENDKRSYKGPLFEALPNDLIISKIRVGQGSFCVIGSEFDHVAVSPEYPVYTPDCNRVDPAYLALVLRTPDFLAQLVASASGNTTKRRIRLEFLESREIPLPPLNRQRTIVAAHRAGMDRAAELEREADETEKQAMTAFETALGFTPQAPLSDRPAFIAFFKDLDRWSHEGVLRRTVEGDTIQASPYPTIRLREVIADLENGWSPKCHNQPAEKNEWGVLKLGSVSFGVFNPDENKVLPGHLIPRPHLEVAPGQLLISRANITRLVGATVLVEKTRPKLMLCDKIFRAVPFEHTPVDMRFLAQVLRISDVRRQIEANVTGTSPTMKNIAKPALMNLTFPLPPKPQQISMANALAQAHARAVNLRQKASKARTDARNAFEAAVYAP